MEKKKTLLIRELKAQISEKDALIMTLTRDLLESNKRNPYAKNEISRETIDLLSKDRDNLLNIIQKNKIEFEEENKKLIANNEFLNKEIQKLQKLEAKNPEEESKFIEVEKIKANNPEKAENKKLREANEFLKRKIQELQANLPEEPGFIQVGKKNEAKYIEVVENQIKEANIQITNLQNIVYSRDEQLRTKEDELKVTKIQNTTISNENKKLIENNEKLNKEIQKLKLQELQAKSPEEENKFIEVGKNKAKNSENQIKAAPVEINKTL